MHHFHNPLHGKDKESIVKVIHSIEGYADKPTEILDIKDFDDVRVVGFLYNNNPAYMTLYKNVWGNYKWKSIEVRNDETLSAFLPSLPQNIPPKMMYVSTFDNKLTTSEVDVNGQLVKQQFPTNRAFAPWVDIPTHD